MDGDESYEGLDGRVAQEGTAQSVDQISEELEEDVVSVMVRGEALGVELEVENVLEFLHVLLVFHGEVSVLEDQVSPHWPARSANKAGYAKNSIDGFIPISPRRVGEAIEL